MCRRYRDKRGAALITVLWLTAALAVIGFSVAQTVIEETRRTENDLDGARAMLLARGAIEKALLPQYVTRPEERVLETFPGGDVLVERLGETGKLNINGTKPEHLMALFLSAGLAPHIAVALTEAIVDWRTPPPGGVGPLDAYYLSVSPTFQPRHASFEQIEELLLVRGVTPAIYFGGMERTPAGTLVERPGLRELLSVQGGPIENVNANSAHPAVLAAAGLAPAEVALITGLRRAAPLYYRQLAEITLSIGPASRVLHTGLGQAYTIKATARPRTQAGTLSDYRRTAAALVVIEQPFPNYPGRPVVRRWQDQVSTQAGWPGETPRRAQ